MLGRGVVRSVPICGILFFVIDISGQAVVGGACLGNLNFRNAVFDLGMFVLMHHV